MNRRKPYYALDLNITQSCNLRCKYCIQDFSGRLKVMSPAILNRVKEKVDYLINEPRFREIFDGITIFFWGGEPSTQPQIIDDFIERYKDNNRVNFFIYSNGFNLKGLYPTLLKYKDLTVENGDKKYSLQISYDGAASHDVDRVDIKGNGTASRVRETILQLSKDNIVFGVHPTIAAKNFDKIAANHKEFNELRLLTSKPGQTTVCESYNPTIDYLTDYSYLTEEQMNEFKKTITEQFKLILKDEISFYKQYNRFFLSWLNPSRALCSAAYNLQAVDQDGSVRACHGAFYLNDKNKQELTFNSIFYDNKIFLDNLVNTYHSFHKYNNYLPDECKNCYAEYCMKCNTAKFSHSEKETIHGKWTDYTDQPYLCDFYRHITKLKRGILKLL